jgi:hypothetical protein
MAICDLSVPIRVDKHCRVSDLSGSGRPGWTGTSSVK